MDSSNIILIGYMGSGKSSVAAYLTKYVNMPVFDIDAEIERRTGLSISDIFATEGEEAFRKIESEILGEAVKGIPKIIACGGGIVLDPDNRNLIKNSGIAIFLDAEPEILFERSRTDSRPLKGTDINEFKARLKDRIHLYEEVSSFRVDADSAVEIVAENIARKLGLV